VELYFRVAICITNKYWREFDDLVNRKYNYPAPDMDRGTGYCFRSISFFLSFFLCFFVSLSARLRENGWTDLRDIFREGVE